MKRRADKLARALSSVAVPEADAAERRARRVVLGAFEASEPVPARRRRSGLRLALGVVVAAVLAGVAVASPGSELRRLVREAVVTPTVRQLPSAPMRLPGGGNLLVRAPLGSPSALWVVHADGSRTLLGHYRDGSWSPHARFVVATVGDRLVALDPHTGTVHWTLNARAPVRGARWSLEQTVPPCCRIAYLTGGALRVVAGDGSGDRQVAPADPKAAPAWRPGDRDRALAYVDPSGAVRLIAADSGKALAAPYHHGFRPTQLVWSSDGRRLLVLNPVRLVVLDASLRQIGAIQRPSNDRGSYRAATFAPHSHALIVLRRLGPLERARVELLWPGRPARALETLVGDLSGLAPSPDGNTVLVGWGAADQWLLVPTRGNSRARRVTGLVEVFGSAATPVANAWARGN